LIMKKSVLLALLGYTQADEINGAPA